MNTVTPSSYLSLKNLDIKIVNGLNPQIAKKLQEISNDYDLLVFVKENIDFFYSNGLIPEEWFSLFLPDTLQHLHIYTSGNNNVLVSRKSFTGLVVNCHLSLDVLEGAAEIKTFGKAYLDARLMGASASAIHLRGNSTAEVAVSGNAVASIATRGNSNLNITNQDESLVRVNSKSLGDLTSAGTENLIITKS